MEHLGTGHKLPGHATHARGCPHLAHAHARSGWHQHGAAPHAHAWGARARTHAHEPSPTSAGANVPGSVRACKPQCPGVNGVKGGRARTRLMRPRTCTGVHECAAEVLPVPVSPPACALLLHAHARAPAENGTCPRLVRARVCHCWGHALIRGTAGQPRKATCPIPRGQEGSRTTWPRPRPPPGLVLPRDCFLRRRKPHCSRGQRRFRSPLLARGSAAPHTCEGPRHRPRPTGRHGQRARRRA